MLMYSADIFISANAIIVANDKTEASQMVAQVEGNAVTVPEDEFFTDRFFNDPQLANFTFATTFTLWTLLEKNGLFDFGRVDRYLTSEAMIRKSRDFRLFFGKALLGATVYLKANRRSEAEARFQLLDQTEFKFKTNKNGIALLGLNELVGIGFEDKFTCHILEEHKLKHRGPCAPYSGSSTTIDRPEVPI